MDKSIGTVDDYIKTFPTEVKLLLEKVRLTVRQAAPEAIESIGYGMPAYKLKGKPLVYFAAFKGHIGLYATPSAHQAFAAELSHYKQGKGSVQFPLDKPLPLDLIRRMVEYKVKERISLS